MIDQCYQLAYKCAYQMMRTYWKVRRPRTHGALVAIWHEGRVLLVRNSYVKYYSLPGGYVHSNETGREAARRELKEEVALDVAEDALQPALDVTRDWEGKRDRVELFELHVECPPQIAIDNREVVAAGWYTPEEALELDLFPTLREHVEDRQATLNAPSESSSVPVLDASVAV
jgi:8-oxo-dGTP pyrophosphatase MutT (NUDIX family)